MTDSEKKKTILILDDMECIHIAIIEMLEGEYTIISAYSAAQSRNVLKENKVDLIILDNYMPGVFLPV